MQTDYSTAHALLTNKILPKALKAMDMHFHWLRCRDAQGQFRYYWRPGTQNLADYWTKHHPASHHTAFRPQILTSPSDPEYTKLFTKQATTTKSFVDKILMTPKFQEMAAKQHMVAAEVPKITLRQGCVRLMVPRPSLPWRQKGFPPRSVFRSTK